MIPKIDVQVKPDEFIPGQYLIAFNIIARGL